MPLLLRSSAADTPGALVKMAKDAMVRSWMNFILLVVIVECDVVAAAYCLRLACLCI